MPVKLPSLRGSTVWLPTLRMFKIYGWNMGFSEMIICKPFSLVMAIYI